VHGVQCDLTDEASVRYVPLRSILRVLWILLEAGIAGDVFHTSHT
jgi:hypothetical protein